MPSRSSSVVSLTTGARTPHGQPPARDPHPLTTSEPAATSSAPTLAPFMTIAPRPISDPSAIVQPAVRSAVLRAMAGSSGYSVEGRPQLLGGAAPLPPHGKAVTASDRHTDLGSVGCSPLTCPAAGASPPSIGRHVRRTTPERARRDRRGGAYTSMRVNRQEIGRPGLDDVGEAVPAAVLIWRRGAVRGANRGPPGQRGEAARHRICECSALEEAGVDVEHRPPEAGAQVRILPGARF